MTIEREAIVRLKVPRAAGAGQAFQEVAIEARKLEADTERAGKAMTELLRGPRQAPAAVGQVERLAAGVSKAPLAPGLVPGAAPRPPSPVETIPAAPPAKTRPTPSVEDLAREPGLQRRPIERPQLPPPETATTSAQVLREDARRIAQATEQPQSPVPTSPATRLDGQAFEAMQAEARRVAQVLDELVAAMGRAQTALQRMAALTPPEPAPPTRPTPPDAAPVPTAATAAPAPASLVPPPHPEAPPASHLPTPAPAPIAPPPPAPAAPAAPNGQAFAAAIAGARQLDEQTVKARRAVAELLLDLRGDQEAQQHFERIAGGLERLGVEAGVAREQAAALLKSVSNGAAVGDREINRLATGLRALGHAAPADVGGGSNKAVADLVKRLGSARQAESDTKRITRELERLGIEAGKARAAAAELMKTVQDGSKVGQAEIAKLAEGMKEVGAAGGQGGRGINTVMGRVGEQAGRVLGGRLTRGLGAAGAPLALVEGASFGIRTAEEAFNPEDGITARGIKETLVRKSTDLPIFGTILGQSKEAQELKERDRRMADLRNTQAYTERRLAVQGQFNAQRDALQEGQAQARDTAQLVPRIQREQTVITSRISGESERAQDEARRTPGVDPREVAARFAFREQQQRTEVQQTGDRAQLGQERERATERAAKAEQELAAAVKAQEAAQQNLTVAGLTAAQKAERRQMLEGQIANTQAKQVELERARAGLVDVAARGQALIVQQGRERLGQLEQERNRLSGVIAAEKERTQGAKQNFGRLLPWEQKEAADIAEKMQRGEQVNDMQADLVRRAGGGKLADLRDEKRGDNADFARFAAAAGLDKPLKDAEAARVQIDQQIKVALELNEKSLAQQLVEQIVPAFNQKLLELKNAFDTQMTRQANQQRAQAANQGGVGSG